MLLYCDALYNLLSSIKRISLLKRKCKTKRNSKVVPGVDYSQSSVETEILFEEAAMLGVECTELATFMELLQCRECISIAL